MIKHQSEDHVIELPENIISLLGTNRLCLINPVKIMKIFDTLVEKYPVKKENLPDIPTFINIKSDTLPEFYAVISFHDFLVFNSILDDVIDPLTKNLFLSFNKINFYQFDI